MAGKERQCYGQSTHRNYVGARENTENEQGQSSQNVKIFWKLHLIDLRGSHDHRYVRNRCQEPYQRQQSFYRKGSYSHPDQRENEQESASVLTPGLSTRLASPRRMSTSQKRISSKVNGNNRPTPPSLRPSVNRSTRSLEGNATEQPASSPSKPAETSAVTSQSIVPNSGDNQAEQPSENSENGSQATSTNKNASNQQVPPPPRPRVSFVKNLPSLVQKTVLKKSEQSSQKSKNGSRMGKKDEPKFIQSVYKNPHLYDPADPFYRDKEHKKRSWTSIGETFGYSADKCESTWRSMRQRYNQWKMKKAAGFPLPNEVEQFVNDMSFLHPHQESIQERTTSRTESCDSDQALLDSIAAELRRLSPDQKGLFKSKIHVILAEISKVV